MSAAREFVVVGDNDERFALRNEAMEKFGDGGGCFGIEIAGRFVRQDDGRIIRESAGYRGSLLLAAGKRRRQLRGLIA